MRRRWISIDWSTLSLARKLRRAVQLSIALALAVVFVVYAANHTLRFRRDMINALTTKPCILKLHINNNE
jgi:hypothetical protein